MEELYKCECSSNEHMFIINLDEDNPDNKIIYIHLHLTNVSFLKRLKNAFKYIFGYKCKYGCFEEIIINKNDKQRLLNTFNKL